MYVDISTVITTKGKGIKYSGNKCFPNNFRVDTNRREMNMV